MDPQKETTIRTWRRDHNAEKAYVPLRQKTPPPKKEADAVVLQGGRAKDSEAAGRLSGLGRAIGNMVP